MSHREWDTGQLVYTGPERGVCDECGRSRMVDEDELCVVCAPRVAARSTVPLVDPWAQPLAVAS